jgi:hypothetical protein
LFAAHNIGYARGDIGAGVLGTRAQRGGLALSRNCFAGRAVLIGHADFDAVAGSAQGAVKKEREKGGDKQRDDNTDLQS